MSKCSASAEIENLFYNNFLKFFKNAEAKRRWNIEGDIPWDKVNPGSSDLTADIVQFFSAVEMYLPDYTSKLMPLIRESRGRAWFHANWGYEESKHSMVLEEWLVRSGKRSEEQLRAFADSLLDGKAWDLPFDHPRQMMIYTMTQELATGLSYTNLRRRAISEGDGALAGLLAWVAADESAHYNFYRSGVKAYLARQPEETVADIKFVFEQFTMPGKALIPGWEECRRNIDAAGIYGARHYLGKVRLPIMQDLGLTRTQLKSAGVGTSQADLMADYADQKERDRQNALLCRTFSRAAGDAAASLKPPSRKNVLTI